MKAVEIQDVKTFMGRLFGESFFDGFMVSSFEITAGMHVTFDGKRNADWYGSDEMETFRRTNTYRYVCWQEMKPHVFAMIRGKRTPASMEAVFLLPEAAVRQVLQTYRLEEAAELVESMALNLRFEKGVLTLVTGCSLRTFTLDKSVEQAWDAWFEEMLRKNAIACEVVG